jgi:hypothetical protein
MNDIVKPLFFSQKTWNKIKKNHIVKKNLDHICTYCLIKFKKLSSWDRLALGLSSVKRKNNNLCKSCVKTTKIKKIKKNDIRKKNIKCSICLENIKNISKWDRLSMGKSTVERYPNNITLLCNHIFHTMCINKWLKSNNTCPNCRYIV